MMVRAIGLLSLPPRRLPFPVRPRGFQPPPSPAIFINGFILSCAFVPSRVSRVTAGPAKPSAFLGLPRPHRDVNRRSPRSRASQARFVPPTTFRTSSTACSSSGLAGLFHPAAASRVHSSGVSPREKRYGLVTRRCPPVVCARSLPAVAHWLQDLVLAFRALFLSRIRRWRRWVRPPPARAPPELPPSSGFPSRTVKPTFIGLSDHGLSRPSSCRPCATCLALASPAPRSRFVA